MNVSGRTIAFFRGLDGPVLSEYALPTLSGLEPHWKVDFVYAMGRHVAAIENTEPAVPAGLTSSASEPGASPWVQLNWLAGTEADHFGVNVYRATAAGGPFSRITPQPETGTQLIDAPPEGSPRWYKLASVDTASMESQETAPRKITAGDAAPPVAPGSLNAEVLATSIMLDWPGVPDTDGDLVGYRLYRRLTTDPPGAWSPLV